MSTIDDLGAIALVAQRLGQELTDRSTVEIATAVVEASDHLTPSGAGLDPGKVERSARVRLSAPLGSR